MNTTNINVYETLLSLGFTREDFVVSDKLDGTGHHISGWFSSSPQPPKDELLRAWNKLQTSKHERPISKDPIQPTKPERTLSEVKTDAKSSINGAAERAHLRYITGGVAQILAYQEKSEEAADYVVADYPEDTTGYPFIQAEARATGKSPREVADTILSKKSEWIALGAHIEEIRIGGKLEVNVATSSEEVKEIEDTTIKKLNAV